MPDEHEGGADSAYLWDMHDAARSVSAMIAGMDFEQFRTDRKTFRAVERELEILGEAARNVSAETRRTHPEIPWTSIIGQRNVLAHEYGQVRYDLLWDTITRSIPALNPKVIDCPGVGCPVASDVASASA